MDEGRLQEAIEGLSQPGRFGEAEAIVARAAPGLQKVLAVALAEGGWFGETHEDEVRKAVMAEGSDEERMAAVRTLLAEEARMGMMVGVAVGWALADELSKPTTEDTTE